MGLAIAETTSLFAELVRLAGTSSDSMARHKAFVDWLALRLAEQDAELKEYLAQISQDRQETLRSWMENRWYERLVPRDAGTHERLLFVGDMEILLPLVYHDISGEVYK